MNEFMADHLGVLIVTIGISFCVLIWMAARKTPPKSQLNSDQRVFADYLRQFPDSYPDALFDQSQRTDQRVCWYDGPNGRQIRRTGTVVWKGKVRVWIRPDPPGSKVVRRKADLVMRVA